MAEFHEDLRREHAVKSSSNRSFGLVMAVAFAVIGLGPFVRHHPVRLWAVVVAVVFLVPALAIPGVLAPFNKAWLALGLLMGRIVSPIMLGVLYFTVFTPMGLLLRLFGKDVLNARLNRGTKSYWVVRDPAGPAGDTLKRQF